MSKHILYQEFNSLFSFSDTHFPKFNVILVESIALNIIFPRLSWQRLDSVSLFVINTVIAELERYLFIHLFVLSQDIICDILPQLHVAHLIRFVEMFITVIKYIKLPQYCEKLSEQANSGISIDNECTIGRLLKVPLNVVHRTEKADIVEV